MALEGIVSKRLDAPYRSGRGERLDQVQCRAGHEVVIGGWTATNGPASLAAGRRPPRRQAGLCRPRRHGLRPRHGARAAAAAQGSWRPTTSPFTGPGRAAQARPNVHWVKPELVAEIEFAGFTGDGMVRQAAFKGLREDKPADEVEAETPRRPRPAELAAARRRQRRSLVTARGRGGRTPCVMGVHHLQSRQGRCGPTAATASRSPSSTSRSYYEAVGPVDDAAHRRAGPARSSARRTASTAQRFFQRHASKGSSRLLTLVKVSGDRKPYLQIDRIEALAAVAQIGGGRTAPLELPARSARAARAAWCSTSTRRRTSPFDRGDRGARWR